MNDAPHLVVGTAGHIDHGKSRLVLALTGTDPDRLPEEKARGMTIDLGFAHAVLDGCTCSFVDVPGHERFIRNMVAGATGIDLALLVVAADDSVMPQTREHAEVLSLLGLHRCILVLTKMDLVDDEWADAVEQEARDLLNAVGITAIAAVRTSALTGAGLDDLRRALVAAARDPQRPQPTYRWFRQPIDRSFVVAGRGRVATGTVMHGTVRVGDEVDLWPAGERVRVRDLEVHNSEREAASGRLRLGINVANATPENLVRGSELAWPGYIAPTSCCDVWLAQLRMPGKQRRQTLRLRLHLATTEVRAEVQLLAPALDEVQRDVFAQIRPQTPILAAWGQSLVLRDDAATRTLGGGRILRPHAARWSARQPPRADGLRTLLVGKPPERVLEIVRERGWRAVDDTLLATEAGLPDYDAWAACVAALIQEGRLAAIESASQRLLLHMTLITALGEDLDRRLKALLEANPRLPGVPRSEWPQWMPAACPPRFRPALAEWFLRGGQVGTAGDYILPRGHRGALSAADEQLLASILDELKRGGCQPPALEALHCRTPRNDKRIRELVDLAVTRGLVMRISDGVWLHGECWDDLVKRVSGALAGGGKLTVSDIRTMLNSTRKFVVPIVERLDAAGITRRIGDDRVLGPRAPAQAGSRGGPGAGAAVGRPPGSAGSS